MLLVHLAEIIYNEIITKNFKNMDKKPENTKDTLKKEVSDRDVFIGQIVLIFKISFTMFTAFVLSSRGLAAEHPFILFLIIFFISLPFFKYVLNKANVKKLLINNTLAFDDDYLERRRRHENMNEWYYDPAYSSSPSNIYHHNYRYRTSD